MNLTESYSNKIKTELIGDIIRINKELRAKNKAMWKLTKKVPLYKSTK